MRTNGRIFAVILTAFTLILTSCVKSNPLCPLDLYSERYNATANEFGFSKISIKPSTTGVCGFAAFDGLFIVCLCTTDKNEIHTADISTGSEYAKLIKDDKDAFEKAALSAAYLILPLYSDKVTDDRVSELAGMVIAAIEGEKISLGDDIVMTGSQNSYGGFELTVSLFDE